MVTVVPVAVVVVLVAEKVLVRAKAVLNLPVEELVIGVRVDVSARMDIIVAFVVAIRLEFAVTVPHSVNVVVDMLIDALTDTIIGVLPGIGVDVLLDVNVNTFVAVAMTVLEFTTPKSLEEFSC